MVASSEWLSSHIVVGLLRQFGEIFPQYSFRQQLVTLSIKTITKHNKKRKPFLKNCKLGTPNWFRVKRMQIIFVGVVGSVLGYQASRSLYNSKSFALTSSKGKVLSIVIGNFPKVPIGGNTSYFVHWFAVINKYFHNYCFPYFNYCFFCTNAHWNYLF